MFLLGIKRCTIFCSSIMTASFKMLSLPQNMCVPFALHKSCFWVIDPFMICVLLAFTWHIDVPIHVRRFYSWSEVFRSPCWTSCLGHDFKSRSWGWLPKVPNFVSHVSLQFIIIACNLLQYFVKGVSMSTTFWNLS